MALWPFGKKNKDEQAEAAAPAAENPAGTSTDKEPAAAASAPETAAKSADAAEANASAGPAGAVHAVEHDAINGDMGPFDGDSVDISQFNFEDFSVGLLDLGSVRIPLPKGSQVQVEMGETGPRMLHILTPHGRMTPVAFAAPRTSGQWAESAADILNGLESDGFSAQLEDGPWGSEIVGSNDKGGIRIIGVEGPRWMYRLTPGSPSRQGGGAGAAGPRSSGAHLCLPRRGPDSGREPVAGGSAAAAGGAGAAGPAAAPAAGGG